MTFRHLFRHAYAYILKWEEMQDLVGRLRDIWETTKQEIEAFLEPEGEERDD